ncbi:MAG: hypothetical protein COA42_14090 [Alteromonadaceae bacterium]|nr:MAG: hypothetical protein COA42_14090 [Alteromonadaceae bacterium]
MDTDSDGVTNDLDNCASTPVNATVDVNGCEITSNNDFLLQIQAEDFVASNGVQSGTMGGGIYGANYIGNGNWMTYSAVNIPTAGTYKLSYRVAGYGSGKLRLANGNTNLQYSIFSFEAPESWGNWITVTTTVNLPAGDIPFKITSKGDGIVSLSWFELEKI